MICTETSLVVKALHLALSTDHQIRWDSSGETLQEERVTHNGCYTYLYFGKVDGVWVPLLLWGNRMPKMSVDDPEESSYVGSPQPTGDSPMTKIDPTGNGYKAEKIRNAFDRIIADFTREGQTDLASQTAKALIGVPDDSLARLHDIMAKAR